MLYFKAFNSFYGQPRIFVIIILYIAIFLYHLQDQYSHNNNITPQDKYSYMTISTLGVLSLISYTEKTAWVNLAPSLTPCQKCHLTQRTIASYVLSGDY